MKMNYLSSQCFSCQNFWRVFGYDYFVNIIIYIYKKIIIEKHLFIIVLTYFTSSIIFRSNIQYKLLTVRIKHNILQFFSKRENIHVIKQNHKTFHYNESVPIQVRFKDLQGRATETIIISTNKNYMHNLYLTLLLCIANK